MRGHGPQSLSALILAEALGIPNLWLDFGSDDDAARSFRYQDWFSLADKPPAAPLRPGAEPQASDLAAVASLHDMKIDERALSTALPRTVIEELSVEANKAPRIVHAVNCRRRPLPVFLPCGDLGARIEQIAAGYRRQTMSHELVLIDGGTAGLETQQAIEALQQDGALVRVIDPGNPEHQARSLQHIIQQYFKRWSEPQRYAIASGAVDFFNTSPDAFALYDEVLDCFPRSRGRRPDATHPGPAVRPSRAQRRDRRALAPGTLFVPDLVRPLSASCRRASPAISRSAVRTAATVHRESGLRVHHPFDARNLAWTAMEQQRPVRRLYW